jgi:hypothetical protein
VGGCVAGGTGGGAEVWSIGDLFRRKCVDGIEWVGGARGAGWCSIPWSLVGEFHTVRLSASGLSLRAEILWSLLFGLRLQHDSFGSVSVVM